MLFQGGVGAVRAISRCVGCLVAFRACASRVPHQVQSTREPSDTFPSSSNSRVVHDRSVATSVAVIPSISEIVA